MTFYGRARATVERMLVKYGAGCTLTRTTAGAYSVSTGTTAAGSTASYTCKALRENYKTKDIDGTLIRQGDVKLLMSAFRTDGSDMPQPAPATDTALFASTTYSVIAVEPWDFNGTAVGFSVQARGL